MRRLAALIRKEALQILRDPSALLIAFVMPLILLFLFGYGINLDSNRVKVGVVLEEHTRDSASLAATFANTRFLDVTVGQDRRAFEDDLVAGHLRGIVVIPEDFAAEAVKGTARAQVQVITDGSEPNIASFVRNYVRGVANVWFAHQLSDRGRQIEDQPISVEPRFWYNPELKSRHFLLPGSIAIVMTLIGTMLTALVVAREWERGTMEALMATPVSIVQILIGKLVPYYILGIGSMALCWGVSVYWYGVPFRGSFLALFLIASVFLLGALGQGLLISVLTKDQFVASQTAIMSAFLPAFMLSGFIFEISAMPQPIQWLTHLLAVRYMVTSLQTLFLTGNVWPLLGFCVLCMAAIGAVFLILAAAMSRKRLDA